MDELSKEYLVSAYIKTLRLHGDRPEAVGWSREGQKCHFESLLDIGRIKDNDSVLDFGCGKGDLYQFLQERGYSVDYTGYDINPALIALARDKYPQACFRVFDMDRDEVNGEFDYIFLCGVFNLKLPGLDETIKRTLSGLFSHCRKGLAFNALSAVNPTQDTGMYYSNPAELFCFAVTSLSPYVSLQHDRIPYDYNLFVYKEMKSD